MKEMSARSPTDSTELLVDFLPSILGVPDPESLQILGRYLYHPDINVRRYASAGLTYWPDWEAEAAIAEWIRTNGPSDVMIKYLTRRYDRPLPQYGSIVESALPNLRSNSPALVAGAIATILQLSSSLARASVSEELLARAKREAIEAADHIMGIEDPSFDRVTYLDLLSSIGGNEAHDASWRFVDRNADRAAVFRLARGKLPADLQRLAQLLLPGTESPESDLSSLPRTLHDAYGDAALPYFEVVLGRKEPVPYAIAFACAQELLPRRTALAFFTDAIERNLPYPGRAAALVRQQFPELNEANDAEVLRFVKTRAEN